MTTVLGTLILVAFAIFFGVSAIEGHLEAQAEQAIAAQVAVAAEEDPTVVNRTDISVEASGQDLNLRGTVGREELVEAIPAILKRIEGVGEINADLQPLLAIDIDVPDVIAAPITIKWANRSVTIAGEVSDDASRGAIISKLETLFPAGVDAEGLLLKDGAPSERDWLSKVLTLITIGGETLGEGELFVNAAARLVQMTGEYETRQERRDARDQIDEVIAETTFAFTSGLSIPAPPDFTPEEVVALQENLDDLIEGKVVEFELNSDVLTQVGAALLDEILEALEKFPFVPIEIGGHTDSQGDPIENLDLSERRAERAFDYLVANGQDPERFVVEGYGEDVPVASNDTSAGRARNRRIEFKALEE
ncbi:MAG: OmpA family protein [Acidimicrobiia bacterium]|nr:OmpA family protein [Acidimicrobiia bacterium]MDX2467930.1 OmpA family protein [Acidimicrobiia bacterium]